jgi:hypothetical protein
MSRRWWGLGWLIVILVTVSHAQENVSRPLLFRDGYLRADRLGITHINSAEIPADDTRYQRALELGVGWTRYPLYWYRVETTANSFTWADYDRVIAADVTHGIQTNAVLMGQPDFYRENDSIRNLAAPIFSDGSDLPRADKTINPENYWARYVFETVQRYKPNGTLAQARGWTQGEGVRVWEVWNEPDLEQFWSAGWEEYARLLKVAYLAAHQADPDAFILFGGLLYNTRDNWLAQVLRIYREEDAFAPRNNFYMDGVAVHSYGYPWRSGWLTLYVRETLEAYGLKRPIWLNETGVPAWDDYPGPVWATEGSQRVKMATVEQQAWFLIQSAAYAWNEGADKVFYHQLFDDCGDEPAGTTFPLHNGELCIAGARCFGSAFGIYRNAPNSVCYNQHPFAGTARPSAQAVRLLAQVFGAGDFVRQGDERREDVTIIRFARATTGEQIAVIWNHRFEPQTYLFPSIGQAARLYTLAGIETLTPNEAQQYSLDLGAAIPDNYPNLEAGDYSAIAGEPVILVQVAEGDLPPLVTDTVDVVGASGLPTPGGDLSTLLPTTPLPLIQPTPDVSKDREPPITSMPALPPTSPTTFTVRWSATDDVGVEHYLVWVRLNGGEWLPWLETTRTEGEFTGTSGILVEFAVWAVDFSGKWSPNVELSPQTSTQIE